jgi:hypothetical protein
MAVYVFYHIFCTNGTITIIQQQIHHMIFAGLLRHVDKVYCFLLGNQENRDIVSNFLVHFGEKFIVADYNNDGNIFERFTLLKIHDYVKEDDKILYIHSKGIIRFQKQNSEDLCVADWRNCMEYHLFTKAEFCIQKLDSGDYDVVGLDTLYKTYPQNHFSGNFWWTTGKYYLSLPRHIDSDYFAPEFYICQNNPRRYGIISKHQNDDLDNNKNRYPQYDIYYPFYEYIEY